MAFIEVKHINKDFKIAVPTSSIMGAVKGLFHRKYTIKHALQDISFSIEKGELIGYIGPNGAGKSTTIKMLTGILTPDSGSVVVNGIIPYEKRKENAKHIGVVFGQRSQLYWDLPVLDTFELYEKLYDIDKTTYEKNKNKYIEILGMSDFLHQPVRQLSLGQKMKANLALAMLHDPDVLYLDEPTIGLDIGSKKALRKSIRLLNREKQVTVMLTTHDMNDIEEVCDRVILIDKGKKLFDGGLREFKDKYDDGYTVKMQFVQCPCWIDDVRFSLHSETENAWEVFVRKEVSGKDALVALIERYNPENISIKEPTIEDTIQRIF